MNNVKKKRDSGMELLRIVAMLLVLILHADFVAIGTPTATDVASDGLSAFARFFFEAAGFLSVNLFVFISGWYGIKANKRSILGLLFQVLFFIVLLYGVNLCVIPDAHFSLSYLCHLLRFDTYWFVRSYLVLYCLSPMLNGLIDNGNRRQYTLILGCLFVMQSLFGWLDSSWYGADGDSPLTFVFVYLLAGYVRKYNVFSGLSSSMLSLCVVGLVLLSTFLAFVSVNVSATLANLWYKHTSPLVLLSVTLTAVLFSRLRFYSKVVNTLAASAFAVYLLNVFPFVFEKYISTAAYIFHTYSGLCCLLCISGLVVASYIVAFLIDQIRIIVWNRLKINKI